MVQLNGISFDTLWLHTNGILYNSIISLASRKTIRESQNQAVLNKLIKEVKSLNQTFDVADIRGNRCLILHT